MNPPSQSNPLAADLDLVLDRTQGLWEELRGQRVFITGGTGFFGCWLLETFAWANDKLNLGAQAVVLSRDPERFRLKAPHLAGHPAICLHKGGMEDFDFPEGEFRFVIHAASELSAANPPHPRRSLESACAGLNRALRLAGERGTKKLLYASSGAVYGPSLAGRGLLKENDPGCPMPLEPRWWYGASKRHCEMLCALAGRELGFESKIVRGFAFIGPYLPLDGHLAAGNFIADLLAGRPIVLQGNGSPVRSYLYGADLAVWLWTILIRGRAAHPYHLGSDKPVSILELAQAVAAEADPALEVIVKAPPTPGAPVDFYVPDTSRARELGLEAWTGLPEAIRRTAAFYRNRA